MKKKDKTPAEKQNKKPQSQSKVHKSGISFDSEVWKQLENYAGSEFKGNKSKACINQRLKGLLFSQIYSRDLYFSPKIQIQLHACPQKMNVTILNGF
ncbi:hypothetical protein KAU88_02485 [Candidatus Bathyarchaeota archaeon]|nr:hypothetical protein [Candidatus Bathyarchaeota archaeon]